MKGDMDCNAFPQVLTSDVPCYCFQCLKNSIFRAASNNSSICYKYVIPSKVEVLTKNHQGKYPSNKEKLSDTSRYCRGKIICGNYKGVKPKNTEENVEKEIDYYTYRMEKREHFMFYQNSNKSMKNLIDMSEGVTANFAVDSCLQDSSCQVKSLSKFPKCGETDENSSSSSTISSTGISKSEVHTSSSTSGSLKLKVENLIEIDNTSCNKPPSDQEMGLTKLLSSNCLSDFPVITRNEKSSKITDFENEYAVIVSNNDSTVSAEHNSNCDKSVKELDLKITKEEVLSNSKDYVGGKTPAVNKQQNLQMYTLVFSDETKSNINDKFSKITSQENLSMKLRIPGVVSNPTCRPTVGSMKDETSTGIDFTVQRNALNPEGNHKPFVIKELWRPLTFSSNNNVRIKSRMLKIKNKEGLLNRNENIRAKNKTKPQTALSERLLIHKKIDTRKLIENKVESKDHWKNRKGKSVSSSFTSQTNLNNIVRDKELFCKNKILSGTDGDKNTTLKESQAIPEAEVEDIKDIDTDTDIKCRPSSRSKITQKIAEKCKGDFSPGSKIYNKVDENSKKLRKSSKTLQNKKETSVAHVMNGEKGCKPVRKYKIVIARKLCFIKRKKYI